MIKFFPKDFYGEEEAFLCFPYFMVRGEPAARDHAMPMYMVKHLLIPGMEYLDNARDCAKVFLICGQFQECFGAAFVEQPIKELLVAIKEAV